MSISSLSWLDSIGGLENLLQGLGSATISGVVAAVTAWFILWRTRLHEKKLATELDARNAARELTSGLVGMVKELAEAEKENDSRALVFLHVRVMGATAGHVPTIELVDQQFVEKQLMPVLSELEDKIHRLSRLKRPWAGGTGALRTEITWKFSEAAGVLALWIRFRDSGGTAKMDLVDLFARARVRSDSKSPSGGHPSSGVSATDRP